MEERPVIYYYRQWNFPASYPVALITANWLAVPETDVPADHIFGGVEPEHEVM
jgi:hypothetical protein